MTSQARGRIVYLVEDDLEVRLSTRALLIAHGYQVYDYEHAEQLLAKTRGLGADCLVIDLQLPGMSGADLVRHMRAGGNLTPALIVSADPQALSKSMVLAGTVMSLPKPYAPHELLHMVAFLASHP